MRKNKNVVNIVDSVKGIIGSDYLVTDVIQKSRDTLYQRHGVIMNDTFIPIVIEQYGYDEVHGKFKKSSIISIANDVEDNFTTLAYLIDKQKCITAKELSTAVLSNVSPTLELWRSDKFENYVPKMSITASTKDFSSLCSVNLNGLKMHVYSFKQHRTYKGLKNIGLIV